MYYCCLKQFCVQLDNVKSGIIYRAELMCRQSFVYIQVTSLNIFVQSSYYVSKTEIDIITQLHFPSENISLIWCCILNIIMFGTYQKDNSESTD